MKSGETSIMMVGCAIDDITLVSDVIFTIKGKEIVTKSYPTEVTYNEGYFAIPLTQEDTIALSNGKSTYCSIEGQINFNDKSVVKTKTEGFTIKGTLATKLIEGNTPSAEPLDIITLSVKNDVVVASVNADDVESVVDEVFEEKGIEENINKLLSNGEETNFEYTLDDVGYTENIYIKHGEERTNDQYIASGFIPIVTNTQIIVDNIDYSASNRQVAIYDENKSYMGNATIISQTTTVSSVVSVAFTVTEGKYIKVSALKKYKDTYPIKATYTVSTKIYATEQDINDIFTSRNKIKLASQISEMANSSNKKIITWVDDDTNSDTCVGNVKSICDELEIKCTFSTITERWGTSQSASVETLKSLQEEGFHITTHTGSHTRWYKADGVLPMFTKAECEADLIKSLSDLSQEGFIDSNYLVYAGSSASRTDADIVGLCRKWCKAGILASGTSFSKYADGKYKINRLFFDKSIRTSTTYIDMLDSYTENDCPWVVFGSHSANAEQFDSEMIKTVLQHAIDTGWEIMTLNEAYKTREKFYNIQEMFGL